MDPSRIQLEDDRFGLIGASFRPQNRATFLGMEDGEYVWSIGIVVGEEDEIQTVEIDEHGAKSSRMLTPGELFEGLQILGRPGSEAYLIVGALTLLGMDLRASSAETAHQFAEVLRAAADDRSWRLPLHLIGQPRDLQLSTQGRDILRQTASALEQEGHARTALAAAQRLELSANALDSIRRRIARKSLQAYRMHGRWYVVLDNLTRSRASELNGTHAATAPSTAPPMPPISPFEEIPESSVGAQPEPESEEPFLPVEAEPEEAPEQAPVEAEPEEAPDQAPDETAVAEADTAAAQQSIAPTEEDLAAFVSEEPQVEESVAAGESPEFEPAQPEPTAEAPHAESETPEITDEMLRSEAAAEAQAAQEDLAREAGLVAPPDSESQAEQAEPAPVPDDIDQFLSESVMEQFIVAEIDSYIREFHPAEPEQAVEPSAAEAAPEESEVAEPVIESEPDVDVESQVTESEFEQSFEAEPAAEAETIQPEPEPQVEAMPDEEEFILTAEEHAVEPQVTPAEAETAEEGELASEELESATEEAVDTVIGGSSDEPEAESVVSETTKPTEEVEPEPLGTEPLGETGEPVAETSEAEVSAESEPAPIDAESAQAIEEPGESDEFVSEASPAEEPTEAAEPDESASGEAEEAPRRLTAEEADLLSHLREEVAFLRQQGQEKDRQIVAWINGGQWLQPFVDQIHSLEQQVERLGEQQSRRDSDRIADLISERDRLRERLNQLETEIAAARSAEPNARRSWFRRMMG